MREVEELAGEPKALDSCYLEVFVKRGSRGLPLPSARSVGRDERDAALLLRSVLLDAGVDVCCRTYRVRERKGGEREGVSGAKAGGGGQTRGRSQRHPRWWGKHHAQFAGIVPVSPSAFVALSQSSLSVVT